MRTALKQGVVSTAATAALCAAAMGGLANPPSASAAPDCQAWGLQGDVLSMTTSDGSKARFKWDPVIQQPVSGHMTSGGTTWDTSYVSGKIDGTTVAFVAAWKEYNGGFGADTPNNGGATYTDDFTGTIQPDGQLTGTRRDSANNTTTWLADQRFACAIQAGASAEVGDPPDKPIRGAGKPIDPNAQKPETPPPPVTNAIKLSFAPPTLTSITATIENSSALKAQCTYDATPDFDSHRDFSVDPNSSTKLKIDGVRTFTTYHVVVSCHDASGKQAEEMGRAETDVVF